MPGDICDNCPLTPNGDQFVSLRERSNKRSAGVYVKVHLSLDGLHTAGSVDAHRPIVLSVAGGATLADVGRERTADGMDIVSLAGKSQRRRCH